LVDVIIVRSGENRWFAGSILYITNFRNKGPRLTVVG
jgi:hypothetical protein